MVDATNITKWERAKWVRVAEVFNYKPVAYVGFAPQYLCEERALLSGREHMLPIIKKMAQKYQPVDGDAEGITLRDSGARWDSERDRKNKVPKQGIRP
jgi:predicted kinase